MKEIIVAMMGVGISADYKTNKVSVKDLFEIGNRERVRTKIKKGVKQGNYLKPLRWNDVKKSEVFKRFVEEVTSRENGRRAILAKDEVDAKISQVYSTIDNIDGEDYVDIYIAIEIAMRFSDSFKYEVIKTFVDSNILELRNTVALMDIKMEQRFYEYYEDNPHNRLSAKYASGGIMRRISAVFNECVGISSIKDSKLDKQIFEAKQKVYTGMSYMLDMGLEITYDSCKVMLQKDKNLSKLANATGDV